LESAETTPRRIARDWLLPLLVFAALVIVWEALGRLFQWPDYVIPLPTVIGVELYRKAPLILTGLWVTLLEALAGPAVVFTGEPLRQTMVLGIYGMTLTLLFFVFQAPDVALSEFVVPGIGLPLTILAALILGPFALLSRRQVQTLKPMRTTLEQESLRDAPARAANPRPAGGYDHG